MNKYLTNKTRLLSYNTLLSKGHTRKLPHRLHVLIHLQALSGCSSYCWNVPKQVRVYHSLLPQQLKQVMCNLGNLFPVILSQSSKTLFGALMN